VATRRCKSLVVLVATVLVNISAWSQTSQEVPPAPVPSQIASARKIFLSNAGEESNYAQRKNNWISGGPNRAYNQFYAAMKAWGQYELVSSPAEADLIFEIRQRDRAEVALPMARLMLRILDPKTAINLWTITSYVEPAGRSANREKNYNQAMAELVDQLKSVASPSPKPSAKN
jgi:hypothetical protein